MAAGGNVTADAVNTVPLDNAVGKADTTELEVLEELSTVDDEGFKTTADELLDGDTIDLVEVLIVDTGVVFVFEAVVVTFLLKLGMFFVELDVFFVELDILDVLVTRVGVEVTALQTSDTAGALSPVRGLFFLRGLQ